MATTLKDIAREVGVSVTTVSRSLAGYDDVAAGTHERIQETAVHLGYFPIITAQRLQKQLTDTLGFIMPTFGSRFSDPFFSEFIAGIGNEAAVHDYDLLVTTHVPDSEGEQKACRRAIQRGWVDGLIVVRTREDDARIQLLCEHQFPYVDEDSEAGMRLLVQHFIDLGHERIGLIAPPPGLMFGHYRLQSFYDTMHLNNLTIQPEWIVEGDLTQRGDEESVAALLALIPRPTAIIGGNDLMAIGAINRIQQHGLKVGQDIAVGGFDDIQLSAYMTPPLTTIHQPIYEIGQETCAMLIDIVNGRTLQNPHVLLTPTLDVRASSNSLTT